MEERALEALANLYKTTRVPDPHLVQQVDKGKFVADAVGHADVTDLLLEHDITWNWRPMTPGETPTGEPALERDDRGRACGLWIWLTVCGFTRPGYGSVDASAKEPVKELIGDAIRNAAMRFGVALTLWSKTERAESGSATKSSPAHPAKKATKAAGQSGTAAPPPAAAPVQMRAADIALEKARDDLWKKVDPLSVDEKAKLRGWLVGNEMSTDFDSFTAEQVTAVDKYVDDEFGAPF